MRVGQFLSQISNKIHESYESILQEAYNKTIQRINAAKVKQDVHLVNMLEYSGYLPTKPW